MVNKYNVRQCKKVSETHLEVESIVGATTLLCRHTVSSTPHIAFITETALSACSLTCDICTAATGMPTVRATQLIVTVRSTAYS